MKIKKQLQKIGLIKVRYKKIDIILMIVFPVMASIIVLLLNSGNLIFSSILFFGIPSIYLSIRRPKIIKKSLIFSIIFAIPFIIILDYLVMKDQTWFVPTIFNFRILATPVEEMILVILYVYFIIMFYKYFLDYGQKKEHLSKNIIYLIIFLVILLIVFFLLYFIAQDLLHIKYIYLKGGIILAILPLVTFLSFFPKFWIKYLKIGIYFFGLSFLYELVALHTNQWSFPGKHFIGFVELFGLRFPFEEFLFWFVLAVAVILSYYEFFADDKK